MLVKAFAVIGANYGDEGKGLITDYLTRKYNCNQVVRFNGGAQAGHTVVTGTKRHVFSHVAAGTFAGADTLLSKHFIVNPLLLSKEIDVLSGKKVFVDENARVTTIYDMAINAVKEHFQDHKHSTCGVGINETVTRHDSGYKLTVKDVINSDLVSILSKIHKEWVPIRLRELGIFHIPQDVHNHVGNVLNNENYDYHATFLKDIVDKWICTSFPESSNPIIFEGAQGLALDEQLGEFPFVTRSKTGLPNVVDLLEQFNITELEPVYVTRAFTTRHGAGNLLYENVCITKNILVDETNVYNKFQGSLRYAPLNLNQIASLIQQDRNRVNNLLVSKPVLALTHMDQLKHTVAVIAADKVYTIDPSNLVSFIKKKIGLTVRYVSFGPTASDISENC